MNRSKQYLDNLTELASEICRQRGWRVIPITELGLDYNINVLGTNVNKGSQIKIRLKNMNNEYFPWFELVGTLCHELAHNEISDHSYSFYKLMDEIHDDIEKLSRYEEIYSEMTCSYYSKCYSVIRPNNSNTNNSNTNNSNTNNSNTNTKCYITIDGTIIQPQTLAKSINKPKSKEERRTLMLKSLENRGLIEIVL
jgi:hypothetical protein